MHGHCQEHNVKNNRGPHLLSGTDDDGQNVHHDPEIPVLDLAMDQQPLGDDAQAGDEGIRHSPLRTRKRAHNQAEQYGQRDRDRNRNQEPSTGHVFNLDLFRIALARSAFFKLRHHCHQPCN